MQYFVTALALFAAAHAIALPEQQAGQADQAKQVGQAGQNEQTQQAGQSKQDKQFYPSGYGSGYYPSGGIGRPSWGQRPGWGQSPGGYGGRGGRGPFGWGGRGGYGGGRGDGFGWGGQDGDENGPYRPQCVCTLNNQEAPEWLTQNACGDLSSNWSNLQYDGSSQSCFDQDNRGLEQTGFATACQRQGQQLTQDPTNVGNGYGAVSGVCF